MSKTKGVAIEPKENELVVLDPEQYELAIQERINTEIKKYNVADDEIEKLKDQYAAIAVPELKDKEGIKVMKDALSHVTGLINRIEDKRKELKEYYLRTGKGIDDEAKRLKDLLEGIREPLKLTKAEFDKAEKEEKERKAKEEEEKLNQRVASAKEAGMTFDGSFYVVGPSISMDIVTLKQMKDADFAFFLEKVKMEVTRLAKIKEEEDRIAAEKAEQERKEREKFELEKAEMEKQRSEMEREQRELREKMENERKAFEKQQADFEEQKRKAAQEEIERKNLALKEMVDHRATVLESMGFVFSSAYKEYQFINKGGAYKIAESSLSTSGPEYWLQLLDAAKQEIAAFKIRHDEIVHAENELAKEKAIQEEKARQKAEQEEKDRRDAAAREAEAERQAALPDVEKVLAYFQLIKGIEKPTVTNPEMAQTLEAFTETLSDIEGLVIQEIESIQKPAGNSSPVFII